MNLYVEIAWTHISTRVRQTAIAVIGVTCGVALTIVMSGLMEGVLRDLIRALVDTMAHVTITDETRLVREQPAEEFYAGAQSSNMILGKKRTGIRNPNKVISSIRTWLPGNITPSVRTTAMINYATERYGVTVLGIDPQQEEAVSKLASQMQAGQLADLYRGANALVVGEGLGKKIGAKVGTTVTLSVGEGLAIPATVVGIFRSGIREIDETNVYSLMRTAQVLAGQPGMINEIRIRLDVPQTARETAGRIQDEIGYRAISWQEANANILSTFSIQRMVGYVVIAAMLLASNLGIYSIISTITNEKRHDIAIMKSFGMKEGSVLSIFIVEAIIIGAVGIPLGWLLGDLLCWSMTNFKTTNIITGETRPMPIFSSATQYLSVALVAFIACAVSAYFPAKKASRVPPVDIIRGTA